MFYLIYQDEWFPLACLVLILTRVGAQMATPPVRKWGERLAGASFISFCLYALAELQPRTAIELYWIAWRGLFAGGLGLGVGWIVCSVIAFVVSHIPKPRLTKVEPKPKRLPPLPPMKPPPPPPPPPTRAELADEVTKEYDDKLKVAEALKDPQERSIVIARIETERRALLAQLLSE